ncbi:MAG: FAD-linked oxidase C-terminal domain-containing protein [Phycisphaerales bacterium]
MTPPPAAGTTPDAVDRLPLLTESERAAIARELINSVQGQVRFGAHDRMLYATDASLYQVEPIGVVIPSDTSDAVRAVEFCAARSLPILPRGGGTSLAGQCTNRAVVIDFSPNCRAVLALDQANRRVRVEPGITVDDLNDAIASSGLFFAADPATSRHANIGGCIGNNAAGARSIRYGRTSESLVAVDVALADGSRHRLAEGSCAADPTLRIIASRVCAIIANHAPLIRERYPKTVRRNAGYSLDLILAQMDRAAPVRAEFSAEDMEAWLRAVNFAHLVCGSEGTLAVTLGAELALHPIPKARGLAVVAFSSLDDAMDAVNPILTTGPTAIELLDDTVIDLARANTEYRRYVDLMPAPREGALRAILYVEYSAMSSRDELPEKFAALQRAVPGKAVACHTDAAAMLQAWKLRKAGEPLLHGIPGHRKPLTFVEDNAVPVERLPEFVKRFRAIVEQHGTRAAFYAHASVGVLHVRPLLDLHDEADRARMRSIAVQIADLARELGGVMSGEHGDGRVRSPLLERFYGLELMRAMRDVKLAFDPRNLLNPGNIVAVDAPPAPVASMTTRLRIMPEPTRPQLSVPRVDTFYGYDEQHGFDSAVEMCNGAGVCRKKQGGTMCPSYMATLDERHSTRGRGNALRLAITGQLSSPEAAWNDAGTIETLELCLSCKACKTECPSNVDIAKLKAEFTAQRHRTQRPSLGTRLMANLRTLNRLGSFAPAMSNMIAELWPSRLLASAVADIDPRRSLPRFSASLASIWDSCGTSIGAPDRARPHVVLFGDCFTMYNESGIGMAARRVLESLGYRVSLADAGCCARVKISMGLLAEAIDEADATLARLRPHIDDPDVRGILFLEPSCLSAVRDDWLSLKLRSPITLRRSLAKKAMLVEEFIGSAWDSHPHRPEPQPDGPPVLLHAHCHQKSLWGSESSAAALRRAVGSRLKVLDTGCCGMAGSFGFTRSRYDLSMKIGELSLFPAVRRAEPGSIVVAPGTSCRHQIHDGVGAASLHPIQLLDQVWCADRESAERQ